MNRTIVAACLLALTACHDNAASHQAPANQIREPAMSSPPPTSSRPPPPHVAPVLHAGVRYEQDMQSDRHGGTQQGGYLAAVDVATGERLWMLKVYEVPAQPDAPIQAARYFRSMRLLPGGEQLEIESQAGGRYLVDLRQRTSTWQSGPDSVHQRQMTKD